MKRLGTLLAVTAAFAVAAPASAHPAPFSYVDITLTDQRLSVTVVAHVFDLAHDLNVNPPDRLLDPRTVAALDRDVKALLQPRFVLSADGQPAPCEPSGPPELAPGQPSVKVRFACGAADPGSLSFRTLMFPYDPQHQTFVNVYEQDALSLQAILNAGHRDMTYYTGSRQGVLAVIGRFLPSGVHHILIGPDHLLFLIGLLLLGGSVRRLLLVVTAFTAAHSVTLSLAALNLVNPPARFVEPAIALSIVYVGADNLLVTRGRDVRAWIALSFGLVHGFGFASVLREMNLPSRALGWSLFSFNVGVEIGQLLVVVVVASLVTALYAHSETAGRRLAMAGSLVVLAAGAFWFVQRTFFPGGVS